MVKGMNQSLITDFINRIKINRSRVIKPKKKLKQTVITDYYQKKEEEKEDEKEEEKEKNKKVRGYNSQTGSWHCIECGVDMGEMNPRQYCGKWICHGY